MRYASSTCYYMALSHRSLHCHPQTQTESIKAIGITAIIA